MFEGVVAYLLNKYLGKYIKDLDSENLNVGIFNGTVQLTDLKLKAEALYELELPIEVKAGCIGKVSVDIPWLSLSSEPVLVHVEDVLILAGPVTDEPYDAEKERLLARARKSRRLELMEEPFADNDLDKPRGFFENLIGTIVNNVQVSVQNVHIRYEDTVTSQKFPFACGFVLQSLTAITTSSKWKPIQLDSTSKTIYKLVKLESFSIYWSSCCSPDGLIRLQLPSANWRNLMRKALQTFSVGKDDFEFILKPISAKVKIIFNKSLESKIPKLLVDVLLQDVATQLSRQQYLGMILLKWSFELMEINQRYRKYHPNVPCKGHAREWWKYAYNSVIGEYVRPFSWKAIKEHRRVYRQYKELFMKRLQMPNDTEVRVDVQMLEDKLNIANVLMAREEAKLELLRSEPNRAVPRKKEKGWWASWFGGGDTEVEPEEEIEVIGERERSFWSRLTPEEKEKLYEAIEYADASTEVPEHYIAHKINFTLANCTLSLVGRGRNHEVLVVTLTQFLTSLETRPGGGAFKISARTEGFVVEGASNDHDLVTVLSVDKSANDTSPQYVFALDFEQNPLDIEADYGLMLYAEPVEVVYHEHSVSELLTFFSVPTVSAEDLRNMAVEQLSSLVTWSRTGLLYALTHRRVSMAAFDEQSTKDEDTKMDPTTEELKLMRHHINRPPDAGGGKHSRSSTQLSIAGSEQYLSASDYSDEEQEVWGRALDVPGFDDNVSASNTVNSLLRFVLGEVALHLSRSSDQLDKPYLMLRLDKLCADVALMEYGPAVQASISGIHLVDKLHIGPTGEYLELLSSKANGEMVSMLYRKVKASCPEFKSDFHQVEHSLIVDWLNIKEPVYRNIIPESAVKRASYLFVEDSDPPVPPGSTKLSLSLRVREVKVRLCDVDVELADISICARSLMFQSAEKAVQQQVADFAQKSVMLQLSIDIRAPTILVPQKSDSPNLVVLSLGDLNMENFFKEVSLGAKPDYVDNILIRLSSLHMTRREWMLYFRCSQRICEAIVLLDGTTQSQESILEPTKLNLDIKRALTPYHRNILEYEVRGTMDLIKISIGQKDLGTILAIFRDNFKEKEVIEPHKQASTPVSPPVLATPTITDDPVKKLATFLTTSVDVYKKTNIFFTMEGLHIVLYADGEDVQRPSVTVDVLIEETSLKVSVPYLLAVLSFVHESLLPPTPSEHELRPVVEGAGAARQHGVTAATSRKRLPSDNTSGYHSAVGAPAPEDGASGLSFSLVLKKPEIVFFADPRDRESEVIVLKMDIMLDYCRNLGQHTMTASVIGLNASSFLWGRKKDTHYLILKPFNIELNQTLSISDADVKLSAKMSDVAVHISAPVLSTVVCIMSELLAHIKVTLVYENYTVKKKVPVLFFQASVDADVHDWSKQMYLTAEAKLEALYYSEERSTWEPLIDPVMELENHYRPWELVIK
ncbi:vacuolar protein-sorting protein, putative, partial [Ixodes scapularis]